jgi:hypothetical protein
MNTKSSSILVVILTMAASNSFLKVAWALDQCRDPEKDKCNEHDNAIVCKDDIPLDAATTPSIMCNYDDISSSGYVVYAKKCDSPYFCCQDGNGGWYYPNSCWGTAKQCCPKGYTVINGNHCVPLNCCDGSAAHIAEYCPNNCRPSSRFGNSSPLRIQRRNWSRYFKRWRW